MEKDDFQVSEKLKLFVKETEKNDLQVHNIVTYLFNFPSALHIVCNSRLYRDCSEMSRSTAEHSCAPQLYKEQWTKGLRMQA